MNRRSALAAGLGIAIGASAETDVAAAAVAPTPDPLGDLLAREAIRDITFRLARAIDRRDWDAMPALFWPDAVLDMDGRKGLAGEFIQGQRRVYEAAQVGATQHFIGNILIVVTGDTALAEIYHLAHHRVPKDGVDRDVFIGGRYVDAFERRNGEWRISGRQVAFDWFRDLTDTGDWATGVFGITAERANIGQPGPDAWSPMNAALAPAR